MRQPSPVAGGVATLVFGTRFQSRSPPLENLDADHEDDEPLKYWKLGDILGLGSPPGHALRNTSEQLFLTNEEEPATFGQAKQKESWRAAMTEEISSIIKNNT
jgi:hypothetical protein